MNLLRRLPAAVAACGLVLATAASAQDTAPRPPAPAMQGRMGGQMGGRHAWMREQMARRRAEHLRLLHDALSIRPDQEGAWRAFVASMAPPAGEGMGEGMGRGMGGGMGPMAGERDHLTTPERLDRMQARLRARLEAFERHAAAIKALYAALSPEQQRTFDALVRLMRGGREMHGMRGGFGHGGMGMGEGEGEGMGGAGPGPE